MSQTSARLAATLAAHHAPPPAIPRLGQSLLDRVGNTPLLRFDQLTSHLPSVTLLGKAEWYNPGGSVKDRAAANIVAEGRRSGQFTSDKILLDATSGNTGIAYAMLGAAEGFPVTLCMPQNVSAERKKILSAYGANILYTDPGDGSDGAIRMARELATRHPIYISTPINTPATPIGWPTITEPRTKSGSRLKAASLTLSPCSAPAEPLWAPPAA